MGAWAHLGGLVFKLDGPISEGGGQPCGRPNKSLRDNRMHYGNRKTTVIYTRAWKSDYLVASIFS